jgi:hypothetical protein
MHYFALAKTTPNAFCAAEEGEPLRGATVTTEGRLTRHYLVGAVSRRAADSALVVELPLTRDEVEAPLARSLREAFPRCSPDPEDLTEIRELLDLATEWPVGTSVRIVHGNSELEGPMGTQAMAAGLLAPVTTAMLRALAPAEALS